MSRRKRFEWGSMYMLTDQKEKVFNSEPAVYVGRKDSDKKRPTICAVCGQPLGSEGYTTFCMMGPGDRTMDVLIGNGCIRNRIVEEKLELKSDSPKESLELATIDFPSCGSWYGTFLHHSIAKPYVRNKKAAENWDESVLKLPGVRYILKIIDYLRDTGWKLDAEKYLKCGNIDLLAVHPEKGTYVFDWKSDLCYDNHNAYVRQVNTYMNELSETGYRKIRGYILWVKTETNERVPFIGSNDPDDQCEINLVAPSHAIRCTLLIDQNMEGIDNSKPIVGSSHHKIYGEEVSFFIKPEFFSRRGYEIHHLDADPCRAGEFKQTFDKSELAKGFYLNFICDYKRRAFTLKAFWTKVRPYQCRLEVRTEIYGMPYQFSICGVSKIDEETKDYVEFEVSEIKRWLWNSELKKAVLEDPDHIQTKTKWSSDELLNNMKIRLPIINEQTEFSMRVKAVQKKAPSPRPVSIFDDSNLGSDIPISDYTYTQKVENHNVPEEPDSDLEDFCLPQVDNASRHFTPGRIYKSGNRYYGVYKRNKSEKCGTCGTVDIAEVDIKGKKISDLCWRYIYRTKCHKEYIYGITDTKWKIYTADVLVGLSPSDMDRYGN